MKIAKNNNKYFTLHIDKFISIGLTYEFDDESKKNNAKKRMFWSMKVTKEIN